MTRRLFIKLMVLLLIASSLGITDARAQEKRDGLDVQAGRDERIGARGKKTYYDKRWKPNDIPEYKA